MIVYQLTSHENAISNIENRRIKISTIEELNDPFELLGAQLGDKKLRASFLSMRKKIAKKHGILCFTIDWHNPVLWGHYGDKHYGLCLGFEVPEEEIKEVEYVSARKLVKFYPFKGKTSLDKDSMLQLLCQKYKDWSYEAEYRGWASLDDKDPKTNLYFLAFSAKIKLKEVVIGPRNSTKPKDIKNIIGNRIPGVKITKSRLAFQSYRVVSNKAFKILTT
ncbi:DUF2971 domain-containing protein [Desulforhopalus sp. IMCC35007]|uniref:DUF2971 domain-containing protein n=1 Tax=Desulforhopalus sp. IMCC35007 TaxID=2569543 RepID=UPI0010AE3C3F|nr:DUF2971 domain-containing protein [Desulforhopalus sp. IMCC35007]TKB07450.1 DUF2971 domain-containing protein [Desulforhopalus sp. IMCC35007]